MEIHNPNQLKKLMREEGITNPADIWDIEPYEEVIQDIEKKPRNILELLDKESVGPEMFECLTTTRTFCSESSENFRNTFLALIESYQKEKRHLSPKILNYLLEKKFDLPSFTIANGEHAGRILTDCHMGTHIDPQSLLLMFNLPTPLKHFWWKGGNETWGNDSKDVGGTVIEWGHFYRKLTPIIWEAQGKYENEHNLDFERINPIGMHDPEKYYYLWQITKWKESKISF
ncbi:MAG: hypothetical protein Q8Q18_02895 [bacterium]|nr:hypothetical protein [bacterium]